MPGPGSLAPPAWRGRRCCRTRVLSNARREHRRARGHTTRRCSSHIESAWSLRPRRAARRGYLSGRGEPIRRIWYHTGPVIRCPVAGRDGRPTRVGVRGGPMPGRAASVHGGGGRWGVALRPHAPDRVGPRRVRRRGHGSDAARLRARGRGGGAGYGAVPLPPFHSRRRAGRHPGRRDFVVPHTRQEWPGGADRTGTDRAGMDVFRFEGGKAVEHRDGLRRVPAEAATRARCLEGAAVGPLHRSRYAVSGPAPAGSGGPNDGFAGEGGHWHTHVPRWHRRRCRLPRDRGQPPEGHVFLCARTTWESGRRGGERTRAVFDAVERRDRATGTRPPRARPQRYALLRCPAGYPDGATGVVWTLPVREVMGELTDAPSGRLLGDCGVPLSDPVGER